MSKRWKAVFAVVAILSVGACVDSQAQVKSLRWGIYWLPTHVSTSSRPDDPNNWTYLWKDSHVPGAFGRQAWEQLEYRENTYDWTYLDHLAENCGSTGKDFEIAIAAGMIQSTQFWPNWLIGDGVKFVTLHNDMGVPITIPVPWDPVYNPNGAR